MRYLALFLAAWAASTPATAQVIVADRIAPTTLSPQFFTSLIAGVVLAYGIQLLLTTLSVALGLSLTPNLKEVAARRKVAALSADDAHFADLPEDDADESSSRGMKITSGIGLWAVITTTIALFSATWLAVHLSTSSDEMSGLALGLVIWAAFFVTMTYLEIKSISSLIGGLLNSALSGIRMSFGGLEKVVGQSPEKQAELTARRTVRGIYDEVDRLMRKTNLDRRLENYLSRMESKPLDYQRITSELASLINQVEIEERSVMEEGRLVRVFDLHLSKNRKLFTKEAAGKLQNVARDAINVAREQSGGSRLDQAFAIGERLAPLPDEEARAYRQQVEEYLRQTGREELDPDSLKADLERILYDPKATREVMQQRLASFDRDTLVALVAQHPSMDQTKAERAVGALESALSFLRDKHGSAREGLAGQKERLSNLPSSFEARIEEFFNGLDRPELDYSALRTDIQQMFDDPAHAPAVLKKRLSMMDRNSIIALLSANSRVSEAQAEMVADKIIAVRDATASSLDKVTSEVSRRYETLQQKAIVSAEHTRKNAIAASWWTLAAAALSAAAAASAGYIAAS